MKKLYSFLLSTLFLVTILSGAALADGFTEDPEAIAEKLKSVLMLEVFDNGDLIATGSGFCAFNNRTLITNYHVVKGADYLLAYSDNGDPYIIYDVLAADEDRDIAILSFFSPTDLIPLSLNTDGDLRRAEKVVAIGSPLGITNTVAIGNISGIYTDEGVSMIQFTAPISPGSSGGALFDDSGRIIGITTSSLTNGQNINLAIHISEAVDLYSNWDGSRTNLEAYQPSKYFRTTLTPKSTTIITPKPTIKTTPSPMPITTPKSTSTSVSWSTGSGFKTDPTTVKTYFSVFGSAAEYEYNWNNSTKSENGYTVYTAKSSDSVFTVKMYAKSGKVHMMYGEASAYSSGAEKMGNWLGASLMNAAFSLYFGEHNELPESIINGSSKELNNIINQFSSIGNYTESQLRNGIVLKGKICGYPYALEIKVTGSTVSSLKMHVKMYVVPTSGKLTAK